MFKVDTLCITLLAFYSSSHTTSALIPLGFFMAHAFLIPVGTLFVQAQCHRSVNVDRLGSYQSVYEPIWRLGQGTPGD